MLVVEPPLPPGFMTTIWRDDDRFCSSYFGHFKEQVYSSLDWAVQDEDGYTYILGRTDDVINVAGHRLGTREIEESAAEASRVAEAAVIGVPDEIKGQVPVAFVTLRKTASDELQRREAAAEIRQAVESRLGRWRDLLGCISSISCRKRVQANYFVGHCKPWRCRRIQGTCPPLTTLVHSMRFAMP